MVKATNIKWDTDGVEENLLEEIEIPDYIDEEDDDAISDYISDMTGFCHFGFDIEHKD